MKKTSSQNMENPKKIIFAVAIMLIAIGASGCANDINNSAETDDAFAPENSVITPNNNGEVSEPVVNNNTMKTLDGQEDLFAQYSQAIIKTNLGNITVKFYGEDSPVTVNNFMNLAKKGFYNETKFHRVIKDFMIQGGDPLGTGMGGPDYKFEDEIDSSLTFDAPGILAMANSGPNTNGSQFFITIVPTPWLNGKHTIFGKVISGQDIVTKIEAVKTDANDRQVTPVTLISVAIDRTVI